MLCDIIIFTSGIVCGYFLTKCGYSDKFVEFMHKKYIEARDNKNGKTAKMVNDFNLPFGIKSFDWGIKKDE